jgi:Transmembrane family, TMEM144 of transporters
LVSFTWGIFVFQENIHSKLGACVAIFCMMLGLFGMSYYSAPPSDCTGHTSHSNNNASTMYEEVGTSIDDDEEEENPNNIPSHEPFRDNASDAPEISTNVLHRPTINHVLDSGSDGNNVKYTSPTLSNIDEAGEPIPGVSTTTNGIMTSSTDGSNPSQTLHDHERITHAHLWGITFSKRHLGTSSAAFCGLYGGSVMAPMKYSTADTKGTHYLLSFAIGAAIVNVTLWILRYVVNALQRRSWTDAYYDLPAFHLRKMWLVGGTSGVLWSIGNFFSLISVYYLGEGVGYPLVQTSILISGLWGLFYFKEIQGTERISKWLLSSIMTVFGILLLSFEHHTK